MVKYAAPTCGPCHTLKPILGKVIDEFEGRIHFVEIDITEDPDIAKSASVIGTPTVQFFKEKALIGELRGIKQKSQYREIIYKNLATSSVS
jgi:thioredoxin reductase (NADPH)